jgi:hypothetical protein
LEAFWEVLTAQSDPINVIINALMLGVWVLYFQLLLNGQRRQRRAKILINRSAGKCVDANCIISNMSAEPIYVEAIVFKIGSGESLKSVSLTNLEDATEKPRGDARAHWFQGPINQGDYINLGPYRALLQRATGEQTFDSPSDQALEFEVSVIANYGPDDLLVAAVRRFRWQDNQGTAKLAAGRTRQVRNRVERAKLDQLAEDNDF